MYKNKKLQQIAFYSGEKIHASEITKDHFVSVDNLNQNKQGISSTDFNPKGNLIFYKKGDTLVGNIRPYLKKIWYASNDGGCSPDVLVIRPKNNIDSKYLFYSLFRDDFFVHMMNGAKGTKMPRGDKNQILQFQVPNFSLNEQNKIASVLSSLDDKIELNNRINADLEQMAKTIYDYWFVQFDFPISTEYAAAVGKPELAGKPYKSSGGKMVWSDELKRDVPEGWEVKELSDIANITMGQSPPGSSYNEESEGTIFFQGCTDFGNRFPTIRKFTTEPTRFAKKGDILLSVRAPVGTINIANNYCCIGRGLAALNSKDNCIAFLFGVMLNLKQIFDRRNTDGTTFGSINKDDLYSLKVVKPSSNVLEHFHKLINPSFELQNKIESENQELTSLRDWLLPMLMNGQVSVGDVVEDYGLVGMAAEPVEEYNVRGK